MKSDQNIDHNKAVEIVKRYRRIEEILPGHWTDDWIVANGIRQHFYRTGGNGPPLVLLHGFSEGALSWIRAARVLEPDYDVVMIDARGHGQSEGIEKGFSQELLTDDAAGVIQALKIEKSRLLGFSMGGITAIHVADRFRDLVRALIVGGAADKSDVRKDFTQYEGYKKFLSAYISWLEQLKTQSHEERMVSALSHLFPGAAIPPEDDYVPWVENLARLDLSLMKFSPTLWANLGAMVEEADQVLRRVTCPVLLMKSSFFPKPGGPRSVQEEKSDQPNVRIVRFVNSGHLIHRERFDEFITLVKDFFKEH
jgi:N-formylmaleamate deformylase